VFLVCFIFTKAIAASPVCHQRNAIFGRSAGIFVLTHLRNEAERGASSVAQKA
jgi:hypothetical protein